MELHDVGVIGGGITGASAANHLVAAGYSTLLLEQGDFAGATTGRTSRLQYSGLSYLDACRTFGRIVRHPGDAALALKLASRSMRDRSAFIRAVPERVRPVPFHLPIYQDGPISMRMMMLGLRTMETLDRGGVPLEVSRLSPEEARRDPCLRHLRDLDRLVGVVRCVEHQFDWPERICVDAVFNAQENGAEVRNYTRVEQIGHQADGTWRLQVRDLRDGAERTHAVRAIVNAAGAWVDRIARGSSLEVPRLNQGAKGSNVAVRLPEPFRGQGFEGLTRSGEPFYVIPWGDLHYFGPANRPQEPTEEGFRVGEDEVAYLLDEFDHLFPSLRIRREDVLYTWAGVRPRTAHPRYPAGGAAVRAHDLTDAGAPGYFVYTGGLLMVHRSAAREIVASVGKRLKPSSATKPLLGSARTVPTQADRTTLHGARGPIDVAGLCYACEQEQVVDLEDLMRRRVSLGWDEGLGCDVAHEVAITVRGTLGWSAEEAQARAERYISRTRATFSLRA